MHHTSIVYLFYNDGYNIAEVYPEGTSEQLTVTSSTTIVYIVKLLCKCNQHTPPISPPIVGGAHEVLVTPIIFCSS